LVKAVAVAVNLETLVFRPSPVAIDLGCSKGFKKPYRAEGRCLLGPVLR
jgi:hypothetical protein